MVFKSQREVIVRIINDLSKLWWDIQVGLDTGSGTFGLATAAIFSFFHIALTTFIELFVLLLNLFILPILELMSLFLFFVLPIHLLLLLLGAVAAGQLVQENFEVIVYLQRLDVLGDIGDQNLNLVVDVS